jgi:hypothetical protein
MNLNQSQIDSLKEVLRTVHSLSIADITPNHSTCSCYQIKPFHSHWDETTAKEISQKVRLYINTWIKPKLLELLEMDIKQVDEMMLLNFYKREIDRIEHNLAVTPNSTQNPAQ